MSKKIKIATLAAGLSPNFKIMYYEDRNVCTVEHENGIAVVMGTKI